MDATTTPEGRRVRGFPRAWPWLVWGILLLTLVLSPVIAARIAPIGALQLQEEAERLLSAGETASSIVAYEKAIEGAPDSLAAYLGLVAAYHQAHHEARMSGTSQDLHYYQAILRTYQAALAIKPSDIPLISGYAITLTSAERYGVPADWPAARMAWEHCLELQDASFLASRRWEDNVARVTPLMYLARIAMREGDTQRARYYLQETLAVTPSSHTARRLLAQAQ